MPLTERNISELRAQNPHHFGLHPATSVYSNGPVTSITAARPGGSTES
jgi:hypothetical protein